MSPSTQKSALAAALATVLLLFSFSLAAQERPKPEQVFRHDELEVVLPDFPADGLILDIGGGGEGVIGQLKGRQTIPGRWVSSGAENQAGIQ